MNKFWMIYCPSRGVPAKQHATIEEAKAEAERIARKERTDVFILEAVAHAQLEPMPVVWSQTEPCVGPKQ